MSFLSKGAPALLGLDISSTAVKLVELSRKGSRYRIESYAVEPLPVGSVVEKTITNPEAVGESIKRALRRSKTRTKRVAVAVAGSAVITKIIPMPASLNDEEMASQIELEAHQYIPYPLEEVNLDFQIIGPSAHEEDMVDVLLAASRSENVDMRIAAVESAGLTASIVDVEAYATETALSLLSGQMPNKGRGKTLAVIDIGATMTSLNVLDDLRIVYTREQIFGGKQLTEEIQQRYNLSYEDAGRMKKQGGLPEDYLTEVLEPFKEAMAQQITRSLQFFFSSTQYNNVDHILLAGGNALVSGIAQLIETKTGTPTSIANPFVGMTVAPHINAQLVNSDAPALIIACGLALRSFD
ncbi:MAG TPA: pilus assembly protein PilM [Gammaproteobacteria bacterium]|nr:pilus assembly protein PilM [Gammaproteobacteria bacterium]